MAMIKVTAGNTTSSRDVVVDSETTIRNFLNANNIATAGCTVTLDSEPVFDLDATFDELGIEDECFLFSVVNSKNA